MAQYVNCRSCGYAHERGKKCTNPACPTVNPEAAARHRAEGDRRRREQAERERLAASARRSMERSSRRQQLLAKRAARAKRK